MLEKPLNILCAREYYESIDDSVHFLLSKQIEAMGVEGFFDIQKKKILSKQGGQFIYAGLHHNVNNIKSKEGIDIVWLEEAHTISQNSLDVLIPTIRKDNSEIWISFNPDEASDPVYKEYVDTERENAFVQKVNYYDNPYFPEVLRSDMEYMKKTDPDRHRNIWLGECKEVSDAVVFKGKYEVADFNAPERTPFYFGSDFGFSIDPITLSRFYIIDRSLYIDYEAYKVGVEIDDTPAFYDTIPESRDRPIIADSARPELISYLRRQGFDIKKSKKGKNSPIEGIEFMRSFEKIYIHKRCKHTAIAFAKYSYKTDKAGDPTNVLDHKYSDIIDGIRYGLERVRKGTGKGSGSAGKLGL